MDISRDILSELPRRVLAALVCIIAILAAMSLSASRADAATIPTLGVYTGSGNLAGLNTFSSSLGARPGYVLDFLPGDSWNSIEQPNWYVNQWAASGATVVLSVPMIPSSGATLATGATGAYNPYWQTLAHNLLADGDGNGILRIGWEFNGTWFPWSIQNGNAANYAAYWRQIVTTMRAIAPGLRFDWCPNSGSSTVNGTALNPEAAYPGDAYVNYIGIDQYDQSYAANPSNAQNRFNGYVNQPYGLAWQRSFAATHNKQVSFPEWGLDTGGGGYDGGDSPAFITDMYNWFASSNLAYQIYFDFDTSTENHALTDFPNANATYHQLFTTDPTSSTTTTSSSSTSTPTTSTPPAPSTSTPSSTGSTSSTPTAGSTSTVSSTPSTSAGAPSTSTAHTTSGATAKSTKPAVTKRTHRARRVARTKAPLARTASAGSAKTKRHHRRAAHRHHAA